MNDAASKLIEAADYWIRTRDAFRALIEAGLPPVGSDLDEDLSKVLNRLSTLPQAVAMLNYAFDSADVLHRLWHEPMFHVPTDYVLLRAIVDNAVRVIWLLEPDDSEGRLTRAWLLARDAPARTKRRITASLREDSARPSAQDMRAAAVNATSYMKDLDHLFAEALHRLPSPQVLRASDFIAAAERHPLHDGVDGGVTRLWSQLSELVHGTITATEHRMVDDPPIAHSRVTRANVDDLALTAALVSRIVEGALDLFYTRFAPRTATSQCEQ
ncbi:hypothetical protein [Microbacterium sp. LMC-P-041]|uniref:hypothetical protein n=1 Tax=Microbacterium sp. LMC-P-041 TaxID=3040293 RepID=UPI0025556EB5|nr:hypothetical protein [Microbacterium sp. LMC-P-041]